MRWTAPVIGGFVAGAALAQADAGQRSTPAVPSKVAQAARTIALAGARPARLTTPMHGVRQEPFATRTMWVVDSGRMDDSSLCGTGGCDVQFWLRGLGGRFEKIFDRRVLSYTISGAATVQPVVRVEYHGSLCGGPGNAECAMDYRWVIDAATPYGRLAVEPTGGRGMLPGPLIAAIPPDNGRVPTIVAAALTDLDRQCRSRGGRSDAVADELPDLDGDGRAEWATGGYAFFCARGERVIERPCAGRPCPVTIFASGGGAMRRAYRGADIAYLLSYEPGRVRLLIAPLREPGVPVSAEGAKALVFTAGGVTIEP